MFTGLVEEVGVVRGISRGRDSARLVVEAPGMAAEVRVGDSVAVNGACLTVVERTPRTFTADVMAETLARTNLGLLKPGDRVNLERALRLGDRLGGHLVTGHVDGVGRIRRRREEDIAVLLEIEAPPEVMRYVVRKGSVAVDGVSLTVADVDRQGFLVSLIPHTAARTTLGARRPGEPVNLEADIIGKYVERLLSCYQRGDGAPQGISLEFLSAHGFL